MNTRIYKSSCEEDTLAFGSIIAGLLRPGDLIALYGDLGTGKTEFIRGVCSALDVAELISSPTFTIVNEYAGTLLDGTEVPIHHIDLYRLESLEDLEEIGIPALLSDPESVKLVEWSENAAGSIPPHHYEIRMSSDDDDVNCRSIAVRFPEGVESPVSIAGEEADHSAGPA